MMHDITKSCRVLMMLFLFVFSSSFQQKKRGDQNNVTAVKLTFVNTIKGSKIVFNDSTYTNSFGEKYVITKLRYYVTNVSLQSVHNSIKEKNSYHLIDESKTESQVINFSIPGGDYTSLQFLLGVDSLHNVSGAQTDDLDPAKDMFWTWNTGYVMAKMEGNSPNSNVVNNKFEFHIGGFSGPYNVLQQVQLNFPEKTFHFVAGKTYEIIINADINAWWQHPHDIKISEHAVITSPGKLAREISDNYTNMFHIEKIISE
ncbi:MAG: MbnP family protein [Ginsengibacter sp.]